MVKVFFLIACVMLSLDNPAFSTEMKCDYGPCHSTYYRLGKLYECDIPPMPSGLKIFSRDKTEVTSVVGEHDENKSNDDVEAIRAHLLYSIHYFPSGLGNFFKNIKAISLFNCELKELHQSDFRQFPNLAYFRFIQNEIEVIEQGLFDYNPDLAYVELLHERRLLHIDPTVFDNLNNIIGLDMSINCYKNSIYSSTIDILEAIKVIKNDCVSSDYLVLETEIKQLESESKTLDTEAFKSSLKTFDDKNSNSVFLKYQPLKKIYESLKSGQ